MLLSVRGKDTPGSSGAGVCHAILGTACDVRPEQLVDDRVASYVTIDPKNLVVEPYAFAERGEGREYFWNQLLKSSLFGTHNRTPDPETAYEVNRVIAHAMNLLLLGMLAFAAVAAVAFARRRALRRFGPLLVCLLFCVAFVAGFRILIPAPHHNDFRHIFSSLALAATLYAAAVGRVRARSAVLEGLGRWLAIAFVGLSVIYFLPKQSWAIGIARHDVARDLSRHGAVVPEGTDWDAEGNLVILPEETVDFAVPGEPTASAIDVSLDGNDRYEISIVGDETRTFVLGPTPGKTGLVRYMQPIDPPVTRVRAVRVRPLSGDYAYSLGHIRLVQ
jgi:hypothetical protein